MAPGHQGPFNGRGRVLESAAMRAYPAIDPVAFSIGPISIHWYGLAYLAAFAFAWWYGMRRASRPGSPFAREHVADLIFYGALGVIIGGRVGYVLFYGFERLLADPLYLFAFREGGMSFHGGMIGLILAVWWFGRRTGKTLFQVTDFVAPLAPIGLGFGRLGNFANAELPGRVTDVPWALVYPGDTLARHPSALYQAFAEGLVLFVIMVWFARRPRSTGVVSAAFLIAYGCLRFTTEFFREPDAHLGFVALDWLTMGQLLSLPMIVCGIGLAIWALRRDAAASTGGRD